MPRVVHVIIRLQQPFFPFGFAGSFASRFRIILALGKVVISEYQSIMPICSTEDSIIIYLFVRFWCQRSKFPTKCTCPQSRSLWWRDLHYNI